ncbi:MAG: tetratricopeptide repeat protein [Candidatus Methanomethylophilaceae archaeon]
MRCEDIEEMRRKADEGDTEAAVKLGISYLYGDGVDVDYVQAFMRLQDAALKNDGQAQLHLGHMYENGLGIEKDIWTALTLYRRSYGVRTPGSRKAMGNAFDMIVEEIPVTGSLTIGKKSAVTSCCERFKEHMRMGRVILLEDGNEENFYMSNTNHDFRMDECPFCGCTVVHEK